MRVGGGDSRHGVTLVEHLGLGEHVPMHVGKASVALPDIHELVLGFRQVVGSDDGENTVHRFRLGSVDRADAGVGVRAAENRAVQRAGERNVRSVHGPARHLVGAVVSDGPRADHVVGLRCEHHVGLVVAPSRTAGGLAGCCA